MAHQGLEDEADGLSGRKEGARSSGRSTLISKEHVHQQGARCSEGGLELRADQTACELDWLTSGSVWASSRSASPGRARCVHESSRDRESTVVRALLTLIARTVGIATEVVGLADDIATTARVPVTAAHPRRLHRGGLPKGPHGNAAVLRSGGMGRGVSECESCTRSCMGIFDGGAAVTYFNTVPAASCAAMRRLL